MINQTFLPGRIACDLAIKTTTAGVPLLTFRVAVDKPQSPEARAAGEKKECSYIPVVAWRGLGEFLAKYGRKGYRVIVRGRLESRSYTASDQTQRTIVEVIAEEIDLLDWPPKTGDGAASPGPQGAE